MKTQEYDHNKAKNLVDEYNANNQLTNEILERLNQSHFLLEACEKEGSLITYGQSPYGMFKDPDYANLLITTAEIIYTNIQSNPNLKNQLLSSYGTLQNISDDDLFDSILGNLYYGLKGLDENETTEVAGKIEDLYGVEF